jgi:hypothetical protein
VKVSTVEAAATAVFKTAYFTPEYLLRVKYYRSNIFCLKIPGTENPENPMAHFPLLSIYISRGFERKADPVHIITFRVTTGSPTCAVVPVAGTRGQLLRVKVWNLSYVK